MKRFLRQLIPYLALSALAVGVYLLTASFTATPVAHALPEYAARTGEACATCHVSPGGGGPRTLRGLLWSASGRPDDVPLLPNVLLAPGVDDGAELFDIGCAACHGLQGEGLFGARLTSSGLAERKIRSAILRGRERSGMPPFEGQFSDDQLDALVTFVTGLSNDIIELPPLTYPLPAGELGCRSQVASATCGGN